MSFESLSSLVALAYAAAEHADRWSQFLRLLRDVCHAQGADIVLQDLRTGAARAETAERDPVEIARYVEHYAAINPWMPPPNTPPPAAKVFSGEEAVSTSKLRATEFYAKWGKPNDVVFTMGAALEISDGQFLFLSVDRGEAQGTFSEDVRAILTDVAPHVQRALRLHERLSQSSTLRRTLDGVSLAVFIVDRAARIIEMTDRARHLLDTNDGFCFGRDSRLEVAFSEAHRELLSQLKTLVWQNGPRSAEIRIPRGNLGRDHVLVVTTDRPDIAELWPTRGRFILTVLEDEVLPGMGIRAAGRLFGLTPAEIALVEALVQTGSLDRAIEYRAAHGRPIKPSTAHTQMNAILNKTRTNRQGEVIRLFSLYARVTYLGDDRLPRR